MASTTYPDEHPLADDNDRLAQSSASAKDWHAWQRQLKKRKSPKPVLESLGAGKRLAWLWGLDPDDVAEPTRQLLDQLQRFEAKRGPSESMLTEIIDWSQQADEGWLQLDDALVALAMAAALPQLSQMLERKDWHRVLNRLDDLCETDWPQIDQPGMQHHALVATLLNAELPLILAYTLPGTTIASRLGPPAVTALEHSMDETFNGEGIPHAHAWSSMLGFLACYTRCQLLAKKTKGCRISGTARNEYEWLVRQAIRATRADGTLVFSDATGWCKDLVRAALELGGDPADKDIARRWRLPGAREVEDALDDDELPETGLYSEWSQVGVLRTDWSRRSPQLGVMYADGQLQTELSNAKRLIWSGCMQPQVWLDNQPLSPHSTWEESCWFSDNDVDYLELELELGDDVSVQRQLLLAREEKFLYVADAVLSPQHCGEIRILSRLPLVSSVQWNPEAETYDGEILDSSGRWLATVMPLSLPEWRIGRHHGFLELENQSLQIDQSATGHALYAAWFIDLHPRRANHQHRTWRHLTVAEQRRQVPRDQAVGYRAQVGKRQYLFYRSLNDSQNRTVFGQNLICEFLAGRVDRRGNVEKLVELDVEEES